MTTPAAGNAKPAMTHKGAFETMKRLATIAEINTNGINP
jgi:hypothetical protein